MSRLAVLFAALMLALAGPASAGTASTSPAVRVSALPGAPDRATVLGARLGLHTDMTRFVLELSAPVRFTVNPGDPRQLVVDLPGLGWSDGGAPIIGKGLVRRYYAVPAEHGGVRLILETATPVEVREAVILPPQDGHQPRFVLDLARAQAGHPPAVVPVRGGDEQIAALPPPPPPAAAVPSGAAPSAASPPAASAPPSGRPLVVIDPGHGGADPGAIGIGGVHEKTITLAVARELRQQLEAGGRYRARLTRDRDIFIPLRERVAIARDAGADLFISLHADTIGSPDVRGLSIYTLSDKASDREAGALAAKENRADAIAGVNLSVENDLVASILINLAQRDTMNQSKRFAGEVLKTTGHDIRLLDAAPHRQAGFAVLTAPDVPSALVEMGYLSSREDASQLSQPKYRERLAHAIKKAIDVYFASAKRR